MSNPMKVTIPPSRIYHSKKWIRVMNKDTILADSFNTILLMDYSTIKEVKKPNINYYFPLKDANLEYLTKSEKSKQDITYFDVKIGGDVVKNGAHQIESDDELTKQLQGYVGYSWQDFNWFEGSEKIFSHPRDSYHRVDARKSERKVKVEIDGITVAESSKPIVVFETSLPTRYYLPADDISMSYFEDSSLETACPYK